MREARAILSALTRRDNWDRYGDAVGGIFEAPYISITQRTLYRLIKKHWDKSSSYDLQHEVLATYVEQATEKVEDRKKLLQELSLIYTDFPDTNALDQVVTGAVENHLVSNLLLSALQSLKGDDGLDISRLVSDLEGVSKGVFITNNLELITPDSVEDILKSEENCTKFSTGLPSLDSLLDGGLWESELGILLGETHIGKTWTLTHLGANALRNGHPVIHATGEISRTRTTIRYYQSLLGMTRQEVMSNPSTVKERIKELELPAWAIIDFSSRAYSVNQLRQDVLRFCDDVDTQPLIIVDYIDELKASNRNLQERFALSDITQQLRRIASETASGLWSASQVNRPAYGEQNVRKEHVAEAIAKVEKADVVLTLNQVNHERHMGIMRMMVAKARERSMPADREVAVICRPETQSFLDDQSIVADIFTRWSKTDE